MPFLAPLALLALAVVGPIIVAMYLLKLRREDRPISSTFLWRRAVRDVEANAPWQRLRFNWLLLLQLLLLLLLALALARPFFKTVGIAGRNLILVIDRSASMGATDLGETRLAAAKRQAIALVDQLPDGGRATVIAAGGLMEVPAASTTDRRQLREAIESIQLRTGGGSDFSQPLALAAALSAREAESEIAVISDGNVTLPPDLQMPATVRYFSVGARGDNAAISALALQPSAAGQTFFAQVTNYGPGTVRRRVDIYLDGNLADARNLELGAAGSPTEDTAVVIEVPAAVQVAEARLAPDPLDGLPADDRGWAVSNTGAGTRVRLVSPGNRFMQAALGLLPGIKVEPLPAATSTFTETAAEIPVTVLDGVVPDELPPGNLLFIAPPRSTAFFSVTGQIDFPGVRPAAGDEPLLRNVGLAEINIFKAVRVTPGAWARVVVSSESGPLLLAGEQDGRRIVVLTFALQNSDLPLTVAFPLLVSNIVSYLAPGFGADSAQIAPGQAIVTQVDQQVTAVRVTTPDGRVAPVELRGGQAIFADTDQLGAYAVEQFAGEKLVGRRRYAVNLQSERESTIAPQTDLPIAQVSGLQQAVTREQAGRQEIWRWLAAAALLVLIIEWLVYQRGSLALLRDRLRDTVAQRRSQLSGRR
jgi:Ca-activated chloride channel family protein